MADSLRIYIAGPMTGIPGYNLPTFARVAELLTACGYDAVNPGRGGVVEGFEWGDYMRRGLTELLTCDGVATLEGHESSPGARIEVTLALDLEMPVKSWSDWCLLAE